MLKNNKICNFTNHFFLSVSSSSHDGLQKKKKTEKIFFNSILCKKTHTLINIIHNHNSQHNYRKEKGYEKTRPSVDEKSKQPGSICLKINNAWPQICNFRREKLNLK